ncbi:hypothetical protein FQA39_LY08888 [Lamprigera yunnana]|nr:hypothetical protein FQA39_LY08888 [Lamprigera yunnana]
MRDNPLRVDPFYLFAIIGRTYYSVVLLTCIMSCRSKRILELAAQKLKEHVPKHSNEEEAGPSNLSSHLQKQYESEEVYNDPFSSDDSIKDKTFTAASAKTSDSHGSSRSESEELDSDSDATYECVDTNSSRSGNVTPNIAAGIHASNWQDITQSGLNFTLY